MVCSYMLPYPSFSLYMSMASCRSRAYLVTFSPTLTPTTPHNHTGKPHQTKPHTSDHHGSTRPIAAAPLERRPRHVCRREGPPSLVSPHLPAMPQPSYYPLCPATYLLIPPAAEWRGGAACLGLLGHASAHTADRDALLRLLTTQQQGVQNCRLLLRASSLLCSIFRGRPSGL